MTTINPGQASVKKNKSGSYDITYKSSSGTSKNSTTLHLDNYKDLAELDGALTKLQSKYKLSNDQVEMIRKDSGKVGEMNVIQASKADANAYIPTETSHLDQATGKITDIGQPDRYIAPTVDPDTGLPRTPSSNTAAPAPIAPIATAPVATTSTTLIKQGSGSSTAPDESVRAIQKQLGITADGIFGPQTKSAVMAFQQQNGLAVDGIVGPLTQAALQKSSSGTATSSPTTSTTAPKAHDDPSYQYDSMTGKPNPNFKAPTGQVAGATTSNPQAEIAAINNTANVDQDASLEVIKGTLGTSVDTSNSEKLVKSLLEDFEDRNDEDKPKSLSEQFADKRQSLGVDAKETELAGIDAEIAKLDADYETLNDTETNRRVSTSQINRRKSAEQIQHEDQKRQLVNERNSIANELNQKYNTINTMMQYSEKDYENSQTEYNQKFNQAISLINLTKNIEESQKSDKERLADNSKANLQILMDTLKGKNYASLDASTKSTIAKMEAQAGLPSGFTEFVIANNTEDPIVSMGSEFTDASGKRQVPIYTKNPSTGIVTAKVITIGTAKQDGSSTEKPQTLAEKKVTFTSFLKTGVAPSGEKFGAPSGSDGFSDPDVYVAAFENWTGTTAEFLSAFPPKKHVNPASYNLLPEAIRPVATSTRET